MQPSRRGSKDVVSHPTCSETFRILLTTKGKTNFGSVGVFSSSWWRNFIKLSLLSGSHSWKPLKLIKESYLISVMRNWNLWIYGPSLGFYYISWVKLFCWVSVQWWVYRDKLLKHNGGTQTVHHAGWQRLWFKMSRGKLNLMEEGRRKKKLKSAEGGNDAWSRRKLRVQAQSQIDCG